MVRVVVLAGALAVMTACSVGGPVPIGRDTYMLSNTGAWSWSSGDALAGDLFREAATFCAGQGRQVQPVNMRSVDGGMSRFAQSTIQFRCLAEGDPELRRPNLVSRPDVVIEDRRR